MMKGFMNNLVAGKDKFSLLISKLEGLEAFTKAIYESQEALQKQIDSHKVLVNVFQILADDGVKEYKIGSKLFTL
jgi:hypothetical protein